MSQSRSETLSWSSPVTLNSSRDEKLSARQVKRAARAAVRREKSDALKEEGNAFFRKGNFQDALQRYQQAIDVHGRSAKPILLTNLAATYLKLDMLPEAHGAADRALAADPASVKARYRRGMARKHMKMWTAASIDFRTLLFLEPENKAVQAEFAFVEERSLDPSYWENEEEAMDSYSDYEAPALEDDPELCESLSESSDCEHTGNGVPCKFYNRTGCRNGGACRFSHAPDDKSERDALGRNVCRFYLIGVCKFGERCTYSHSTEHLLHKGWWSTTEGIDMQKRLYGFTRLCDKAILDYNDLTEAFGSERASKKQQKEKKRNHHSRSGLGRSDFGFAAPRRQSTQAQSASGTGQPSREMNTKNRRKPAAHSYASWGGYDSDGDDRGMCGFTGSEVDELVCQGVKPWDDDAWDVLHALHGYD